MQFVKNKDITVTQEILKSGKNDNKIYNVEDTYKELFHEMKKQCEMNSKKKEQSPIFGEFTIKTKIVDSTNALIPYTFEQQTNKK